MIKLLDDAGCVISVVTLADLELGMRRMAEAGFTGVHADGVDLTSALRQLQRDQLRSNIYAQSDIDSLFGKTANALSASLNLQLKIFSAMAKAKTVDDIRNAALIAEPLMIRVQGMLANGELLSVQAAQNVSDEDAIVEALTAMTKVARVIGAKS